MDFFSSQYYPPQAQIRQAYGGYAPRGRYLDRFAPPPPPMYQDPEGDGKTLWMGNIDETMDNDFILNAFNSFGIHVQSVKIIRNKENGMPLGYGFVSFDNQNTAQDVLRELNGKNIPNAENDKRFFLKRASRNGRFTVFVGNLPPQITNELLMNAFMLQYSSVSSAKVIMNDGVSKGFGFVSFHDETEYYHVLSQQSIMIGTNPISVNKARNNRMRTRDQSTFGN